MAKLLGGTRIYGDAVVDNNLLLSGEIRGPASLIIDPAAVGDNTGTVVIKGDLDILGAWQGFDSALDASLSSKTTNNLTEGSTNLYYTDARVGTYLTNNSFATQTYVTTALANLVDSAPSTLDTLNELAAALGDDENFATTVTTSLGNKLNISDFDSTFDTRLALKSTSDLTEGLTNLYFTTDRARESISVSGDLSYNSETGVISYVTPPLGDVLPDQTGNAGRYLTTDGVNASWGAISGAINATSAVVEADTYTGDGIEVNFTLSQTVTNEDYVIVTINGVVQSTSSYSVVNNTLTFSTAPDVDDLIQLRSISIESASALVTDRSDLATTTPDQVIDTFNKAEYRTAKYLIQAITSTHSHCTEVLVMHNDTDVYITEYATLYSSTTPLMTISASVDATEVTLTASPAETNTKIDFTRISITERTV